jgi:hypothetical protein
MTKSLNWYQQKLHDDKLVRLRLKSKNKQDIQNAKIEKALKEGKVSFMQKQTTNSHNPFMTDSERIK